MKEIHSLRENVINELLFWIEENLESNLSLDNISKKVGYSKWHLQRVFKNMTGTSQGEYCRRRRLSKTALLLRLTKKDIYEIAMQYGFDSQQTFTRAFRQNFKITPYAYRRAEYFDMQGLLPPYYFEAQTLAKPTIVTLDQTSLFGDQSLVKCAVENGECFSHEFRTRLIARNLSLVGVTPPRFYGLVDYSHYNESDTHYKVGYTVAFERDLLPFFTQNCEKIVIEQGKYARFTYTGDVTGFKDFVSKIYLVALAKEHLIRRRGVDIEIHTPIFNDIELGYFNCQYLVPIE